MVPSFGLLIDTDLARPDGADVAAFTRHVVELGATAERAGFDGVFLPDRHMRATTLAPNQLVNAAALAARTERVHVGTYCSVLPLYHPMHFAEGWAHVDQLSGGRAVVAVGAGYNDDYLRCFGLPRQGFRQRFREGTEIVRRAWAGGPRWSFHGEAYDLDDVALLPGPAQAGGPPIWVAGQGEWSVRFAVEAGDGYAGDPFPMLASVWSDRVARFREGAAGRGVARPEVAMLRHVFVTDDRAEARRVLAEVCLPQFRFYEDAGLLEGRLPPGARVDEDVVAATAVAGPIDECASRLAEAAEQYDLTYLIVKVMRPHDLEPARELAMVEALGAAVPRSLRRNLCST